MTGPKNLLMYNCVREVAPSFTGTADDCKKAYELVAKSYPFTLEKSESVLELCTYPEKDALKLIVLMPPILECCGHPVTVRNRPSFPLVYTTRGTFVGAAFSAECRSSSCGRRYFPSHYEVPQIGIADCDELQYKQFFYDPESNGPYFQTTSQTVFEISLLRDITSNITISGTSFESRAVVYNENFRHVDIKRLDHLHTFGRNSKDKEHPWKLTEKRVEDAWFLWTLVQFFKEKGLLTKCARLCNCF